MSYGLLNGYPRYYLSYREENAQIRSFAPGNPTDGRRARERSRHSATEIRFLWVLPQLRSIAKQTTGTAQTTVLHASPTGLSTSCDNVPRLGLDTGVRRNIRLRRQQPHMGASAFQPATG